MSSSVRITAGVGRGTIRIGTTGRPQDARQRLEWRLGRPRVAHTADDRLVPTLLLLASQIQ